MNQAEEDQRRKQIQDEVEQHQRRIKHSISQSPIQSGLPTNQAEEEEQHQRRIEQCQTQAGSGLPINQTEAAETQRRLEQEEEQVAVRSEREAAERCMQFEQLEQLEQLQQLEELEKEEQVEEERQRKASAEKRRLREEKRERIRLELEKVTKRLEQIGCKALAADLQSSMELENELERDFGYPPPHSD